MTPSRGFTLLEVMVSLSILALALTAIAGINANSFEESNYAKHITVATLLARSKMIDIEEELRKDGFSDSDKEFSGDFSEEGYPGMKFEAVCRKVEVDVAQLIGGVFGGEVSPDAMPDQLASIVGALQGEGAAELTEGVAGSELSQILGGGMMETMFKQVGDTLANSIREITLEISWGGKHDGESLKFVQYVTTTGRLSVRNTAGHEDRGTGFPPVDPQTGNPLTGNPPAGNAPGGPK